MACHGSPYATGPGEALSVLLQDFMFDLEGEEPAADSRNSAMSSQW